MNDTDKLGMTWAIFDYLIFLNMYVYIHSLEHDMIVIFLQVETVERPNLNLFSA